MLEKQTSLQYVRRDVRCKKRMVLLNQDISENAVYYFKKDCYLTCDDFKLFSILWAKLSNLLIK